MRNLTATAKMFSLVCRFQFSRVSCVNNLKTLYTKCYVSSYRSVYIKSLSVLWPQNELHDSGSLRCTKTSLLNDKNSIPFTEQVHDGFGIATPNSKSTINSSSLSAGILEYQHFLEPSSQIRCAYPVRIADLMSGPTYPEESKQYFHKFRGMKDGNVNIIKKSILSGNKLHSGSLFNWLINRNKNHQQFCQISTTLSHMCHQDKPSPKGKEGAGRICSNPAENNPDSTTEEELLKAKMKIWEQNIWTIPNLLTISRICLTPYIGYLIVQQDFSLASGLFIFAGFTDLLDGYIARNWPNQKSAFGSALDPLADKILVSTIYITLSMVDLIPIPLTVLIFARDLCLIIAAFYVRYLSLPPPLTFSRFFDGTNVTMELKPTTISKLNTAMQLSLVCFTLAAPVFNYVDHPFLHGLWYLTAGTTIWSGLNYIFKKDTYEIYKTTQEAKHKYK